MKLNYKIVCANASYNVITVRFTKTNSYYTFVDCKRVVKVNKHGVIYLKSKLSLMAVRAWQDYFNGKKSEV